MTANPPEAVIERLAGEVDLDAVAALEAASFSNPWTRDQLASAATDPDVNRIYVLRLPGVPVAAFCACWLIVDELHINTVAVATELRRRGLATRLIRHVLADAAASGARRATLEVRQSNAAARRMYGRLGFTERGVRPRYYSQPDDDALILWLERLPDGPSGS